LPTARQTLLCDKADPFEQAEPLEQSELEMICNALLLPISYASPCDPLRRAGGIPSGAIEQ
jgi:hypothetical protein